MRNAKRMASSMLKHFKATVRSFVSCKVNYAGSIVFSTFAIFQLITIIPDVRSRNSASLHTGALDNAARGMLSIFHFP